MAFDRPHVAQQDVREAGPHMKMGRMNVSGKTWRAIGITLLVVLLFSFLVWGCVQVWPSPECAPRRRTRRGSLPRSVRGSPAHHRPKQASVRDN
jgi:hypothetical protein